MHFLLLLKNDQLKGFRRSLCWVLIYLAEKAPKKIITGIAKKGRIIRQYGVYVGIPKAKKTGVHSGFFRISPISIGMDNPRIDPFLPFCEKSNSLLPTGLTSIISPAPRNVKALSRDKRRSIGGQKKDQFRNLFGTAQAS